MTSECARHFRDIQYLPQGSYSNYGRYDSYGGYPTPVLFECYYGNCYNPSPNPIEFRQDPYNMYFNKNRMLSWGQQGQPSNYLGSLQPANVMYMD